MSSAWLALLFQFAISTPPKPVDSVLHLEIVKGHGASSGDRTVIYRSGSLIRTDWTLYGSTTGTSYADLARGAIVSVARDRDGVLQSVGIRLGIDRPSRRLPTGRQDHMLGEDCSILRLLEENRDTGTEICETDDGILLWEAFWYPRPNDRTVMYRRATAIERRPVRLEDIRPPRDLLALAFAPLSATPSADTEPDYEAEMVGDNPEDGSYVLRRHGRFFSNARQMSGERTLHVRNDIVTVDFKEDEAGRPRSLEIRRIGSSPFDRLSARWERVPNRAPERPLGESCTWQNNAAIESTDSSISCRTADGITLKTETRFHWTGETQRFTARRLSRRPLSDGDFAPPARALDWAHWGITPVP